MSQDILEKTLNARDYLCDGKDGRPDFLVDGRPLNLRKWTLRLSIKYSTRIISVIRALMPKNKELSLQDMLSMPIDTIVADNEEFVFEMLARSVRLDSRNFESDEAAEAWVDNLGIDEAVSLVIAIVKRNLIPLLRKVGLGSGKPVLSKDPAQTTESPPA